MKKFSLPLFVLLISVFTIRAQSLITIPNDSAEITANVIDEFEPNDVHIELINNTANSVTVTWGMINYTAPVGWEVKLCDNNNCYDLILNGGPYTSLPVAAGDTLDMKFQYTAHLITGTGITNVYAYVSGDSANSVVFLNYKANLSYVSLINEKEGNSQVSLYPNPVTQSFMMTGVENAENLSFVICDLQGREMEAFAKTAKDKVEVSTSKLLPGNYFLKGRNETGVTLVNARFTKVD